MDKQEPEVQARYWTKPLEPLRRRTQFRKSVFPMEPACKNEPDNEQYIILSDCETPRLSELPLNEAVSLFCENTTSHGFSHLFYLKKRSSASQISFLFVLIGCIFGAFAAVWRTTSLTLFSNNPGTTVKYEIADVSIGLPLPDVIVCPYSFFDKTKVDKLGLSPKKASMAALAIGGPEFLNPTLNLAETTNTVDSELSNFMTLKNISSIEKLADIISWRCDELVSWCRILNTKPLNGDACCRNFFNSTGVWTPKGKCYRATPNQSQNQKFPGGAYGIEIGLRIFHTNSTMFDYDYIDHASLMGDGLLVSLQCNVTSPTVFKNSFSVQNNQAISVPMTYEVIDNTKASTDVWPWSSPTCKKGTVENKSHLYDVIYNCLEYAQEICLQRALGCKFFYSNLQITNNLGICNASTMAKATLEHNNNLTTQCIEKESKLCSTLCRQEIYNFRTSTVNIRDFNILKHKEEAIYNSKEISTGSFIATNSTRNLYSISVVTIYFPDFGYKEFIRSRRGLLSWMSSIGGHLGLFFGGSTITIFEFVFFFIHLLRRLLKNCGKRHEIYCCNKQLPSPDDIL